MQKSPKTLIWAVLIVAILACIGLVFYFYSVARNEAEIVEGTTPVAPSSGSAGGLASDLTPDSLSHDQAVAIFAGKRIQFDGDCRMSPARLTTANDTTIMFDNRSRDPREFYLGGVRYALPGYGFKLLRLNSDSVPHTVQIGCGAESGAGVIELQ